MFPREIVDDVDESGQDLPTPAAPAVSDQVDNTTACPIHDAVNFYFLLKPPGFLESCDPNTTENQI
jgi:hypothetical protein